MPFFTGLRVGVPQRKKLRKSDLTRGLVFCAVPHGNSFIDLVTGVVGTVAGTTASAVRSQNGGMSRNDSTGVAVHGDGATTTYVQWPISDTLRGASLVNYGTVLCLGGTTEQVDGKLYQFGGTFESSFGYGCGLALDSNSDWGRGYIILSTYSGNRWTNSYPNNPLGTSFGSKTHLFGYAFAGNGENGNFLGARQGYAWSGRATFGTTTTGRRATVLQPSQYSNMSSATYVQIFLMWDRELSVAEYQRLYDNIDLLFEPDPLRWFIPSGAAPQLLVPISDLSAGGWTPSTGSDLYAMLDESTASDADYIVSTTASSCEMRVTTGSDPAVSTGHVLRYRLLAGEGSIAVVLKQGSTTIASFGPHTMTGSAQDFAQTLSGGEADSITDYSDLRVVFTAS